MRPLKFTVEDADRAFADWGCNCGPSALAAIAAVTLEEARQAIEGFDAKRYTSPTMMFSALDRIGVIWRKAGADWPAYGLARIQWEGRWTEPGVPIRARYRFTHWVGSELGRHNRGVFDINALNNGTGWCRLEDWATIIVPHLTAHYPGANGKWHVTHGLEVSAR